MNKYNIEELSEKLERCRNVKLDDVKLEDVDDIYVVRYNYWGNGYASEALKAVSNYLLDSGYYLVECSCNELNKQSSRVMEKAGFIKDGYIANRRLNKDGTYSGVEYYSKTKIQRK